MTTRTKIEIVASIVLIAICIYFDKCNRGKPVIVTDNLTVENKTHSDSIRIFNHAVDYLSKRTDSNKVVKTIIKTRIVYKYQTLHDSIPIYLRDDLDSLQSDWLDLEIVNLNIIGDQDSIIRLQSKTIGSYKNITRNDTIRIVQLSDSLKSNRKYWRGFKHGVLAGIGVSGTLFIGSKVKP